MLFAFRVMASLRGDRFEAAPGCEPHDVCGGRRLCVQFAVDRPVINLARSAQAVTGAGNLKHARETDRHLKADGEGASHGIEQHLLPQAARLHRLARAEGVRVIEVTTARGVEVNRSGTCPADYTKRSIVDGLL